MSLYSVVVNMTDYPMFSAPDYSARVLDESGELLARIRQLAVVSVDNGRDARSIEDLTKLVTQARNVFTLIESYGPQLLSEEFLLLLAALQEGRVRDDIDPDPVLVLAVEKLDEYVDYLKGGGQDLPLALLPLLNNMRACYGARLLSEALIVSPHFQIPSLVTVDLIDSGQNTDGLDSNHATRTSASDFLTVVVGARIPLMQNLVEWYRHQGEHSLIAIAGLFDSLKAVSPVSDLSSLWMAAEAVTRSVVSGDLPGNAAIRLLLAQLERYLRRLGQELERGSEVEFPDSVFKNLLYYVALSDSESETVRQLKQQYRLTELLPPRSKIDQARAALPARSARLGDSICHSLLQELAGVREALERLDDDPSETNRALLLAQRRFLVQLSATVMLLGLASARRLNDHLIALIDRFAITGDSAELADIATALIQVEHALELYRQGSQQTLLAVDNPDWTRFSNRKLSPHQYDRIVDQFLLEGVRTVVSAQQHFLIACEGAASGRGVAVSQLSSAVATLNTLTSAVTILPLPEIQPLLSGASHYLRLVHNRVSQQPETSGHSPLLMATEPLVGKQEQQVFADLMVCCELYLDPVLQRQSIAADLLTSAETALSQLQDMTRDATQGDREVDEEATALLSGDLTQTTKPAIEDSLLAMSAIHRHVSDWHQTQSDLSLSHIRDQYQFLATLSERHGASDNTRTLEWFALLNRNYLTALLNGQIRHDSAAIDVIDESSAVLPQIVNATAQGGSGTGRDPQDDGIHGFDALIKKLQAYSAQSSDEAMPQRLPGHVNRIEAGSDVDSDAGDGTQVLSQALISDATQLLANESQSGQIGGQSGGQIGSQSDLNELSDQTELLEEHAWADTVFAGTQTEVLGDANWHDELDKTRVIEHDRYSGAFNPALDTGATQTEHTALTDVTAQTLADSSAYQSVMAGVGISDASDEQLGDTQIHPSDSMLENSLDNTLLRVFYAESELHLNDIQQQLNDPDQVLPDSELQRSLHTLHGSARTANVPAIASLVGPLEEVTNQKLVLAQPYSPEERQLVSETVQLASQAVGALSTEQALPLDVAEHQLRLADFIMQFRMQTDTSDATLGLQDLFLEEATELLDSIQQSVEAMGQQGQFDQALSGLRADLHTLKGSSRVARFNAIADLAHAAEGALIRWVSDDVTGLAEYQHDLLQDVIDALTMNLEQARSGGSLGQFDWLINQLSDDQQQLGVLARAADGRSSEAEQRVTVGSAGSDTPDTTAGDITDPVGDPGLPPVVSTRSEDLTQVIATPYTRPGGAEPGLVTTPSAPVIMASESDQVRLDSQSVGELSRLSTEVNLGHSRLSDDLTVIRDSVIDLDKTTDRLRHKLRELQHQSDLTITPATHSIDQSTIGDATTRFTQEELDQQSRLREDARQLNEMLADFDSIRSTLRERLRSAEGRLAAASRQGSDIGQALLRSRLIPFSQHSQRLMSLVRQTASALGREVELQLVGGELEIDRGIHKALMSPLEHLITNAIAHGIESPEIRRQYGKSPVGTVTVTVGLAGNDLIVTVDDDGAGVDLDQLRQQTDLQQRLNTLSDMEVMDALFESGVSTRQQANQYAGRGIGLNAVKRVVDRLDGAVSIESTTGQGTTVRICLAQPVTISQVILVTVGDTTMGLPVDCVHAVQTVKDSRAIWFNGVRYDTCGIENAINTPSSASVSSSEWGAEAVLVEINGQRLALRVSSVSGYRELITHLAGVQLKSLGWVSASGLLPDGQCVFIADMSALVDGYVNPAGGVNDDTGTLVKSPVDGSSTTATGMIGESRSLAPGSRVLIVDDSVTMRAYATRLLSGRGLEIDVVRDGIEALEYLDRLSPDLVLLDLEMPRMGGFEVLTRIRQNPKTVHLSVVIISSRSNLSSRQQASELGVSGFLVKPYREAELMRLLERSLAPERSDSTLD